MDLGPPARQEFNGGMIFVSYLIAVVGAMTALELLTRRTHIRGRYNWLLLFLAAASMGGVGIWSMHFIGNHSLTIMFQDGEQHQLFYRSGFTFFSLVIAILTMFLAFTFIGITEKAKLKRIIPSGFIAGGGIVCMHYIGQVAIDFFILKNKPAYVAGATIIAICAVTAALFIFFKLREQWESQWYKRLGCAMLMGIAVCGMHFTGMAGTEYYQGNSQSKPPRPAFQAPVLIGIISGIVVAACLLLFFIGARARMKGGAVLENKDRRLILGVVIFDPKGRILVKTDGVVPMKKVLDKLPETNAPGQSFSPSYWLFQQLFETTMHWMARTDSNHSEAFIDSCNLSSEQKAYIDAANELVKELRFSRLSDLGFLFDSVITSHGTVKKTPNFKLSVPQRTINRSNSIKSLLDTQKRFDTLPNDVNSQLESSSSVTIDLFPSNDDICANVNNFSLCDLGSEDKYIFLIRKLDNTREMIDLLSLGFRFAEFVFISKTVAEKLQVSPEHILAYFHDMHFLAESALKIYTPTEHQQATSSDTRSNNTTKGVFVGLFVLVGDKNTENAPCIVVDNKHQYSFPMTQLIYNSNTEHEKQVTSLTREEKNFILTINGKTLKEIADFDTSKKACRSGTFPSESTACNSSNPSVHSQLQNNHCDSEQSSVDTESDAYENNIKEFKEALGKAATILIKSTNRTITKNARIHCDVIETPPFSLRAGPSQLIIFRSFIVEPNISQMVTDRVKCTPFPLYKNIVYHITNVGIERFKDDQVNKGLESTYLLQKHLYLSSVNNSNRELGYNHNVSEYQSGVNYNPSSSSHTTQYTPPSLLPPPRAKKAIKETKLRNYADTVAPLELPEVLNLLPEKDRFWWLEYIYEETKHRA